MKHLHILVAGALLLLGALIYFPFMHHSEPTQVGIMRNAFTGEVKRDTPGWNLSAPWVKVAKVTTTPLRVCITTTSRAFNCRLVQFVPEEYEVFVRTEGFRYYWWANRISYNHGYDEEYRGMRDIMRGYAYSAKRYPFIKILRVYEE
ncbi:MAG: hypothetical protein JWN37_864 [Candidatus Nomurabacteria bacterium]|nr:hypothetical protein [Candidatus Nomurabacteria bacterium]